MRSSTLYKLLFCAHLTYPASGAQSVQHHIRGSEDPVADASKGVKKGEIPAPATAVGDQVGVPVPNPHQYTGLIAGGGVAGTLLTIAVFIVASYFCYKWNRELKEEG